MSIEQMLSLVDASDPLADARHILAQLPTGEVGEDEVFVPVTIGGRLALVFPDGRAYWREDDGTIGAARHDGGYQVATTRFRDGEEVGIPAGNAN